MRTITITTTARQQFADITEQVKQAVSSFNISEGIALVYTPHTTAGITINENADPDVLHDLGLAYKKFFPELEEYRHIENNSDAHLKSSLTGCSVSCIISDGKPVLGVWQNIYFCEFDGPRTRKIYVQAVGK